MVNRPSHNVLYTELDDTDLMTPEIVNLVKILSFCPSMSQCVS